MTVKNLHPLSKRLASLGIIWARLRVHLNPSIPYCCGFQEDSGKKPLIRFLIRIFVQIYSKVAGCSENDFLVHEFFCPTFIF